MNKRMQVLHYGDSVRIPESNELGYVARVIAPTSTKRATYEVQTDEGIVVREALDLLYVGFSL
jgi:hypothetical protein